MNENKSIVEVPLSRGLIALIDDKNADLLEHKWTAQRGWGDTFYANRKEGKPPRTIIMHRLVMERKLGRSLRPDEQVDHIDRNGLNNREENLRLASRAENGWNRGKTAANSSGFKGVTFCLATGRWKARIRQHGKEIWLGRYDTAELAHEAYKEACKKLHREFAFPGDETL